MLIFKDRIFGLPVYEVWFADQKFNKFGVKRYFQANVVLTGIFKSKFKKTSLITEGCWNGLEGLPKKLRYDINSYQKFDYQYTHKFWDCLTLNKRKSLVASYNKFAVDKGITKTNKRRLQNSSNIFLTQLESESIKSFHIYIADADRLRLLYSWSEDAESSAKEKVGCNKCHTYFDIDFAVKNKYTYDFGGCNPDRNNGIDKFKAKFGGDLVTEKNGISLL